MQPARRPGQAAGRGGVVGLCGIAGWLTSLGQDQFRSAYDDVATADPGGGNYSALLPSSRIETTTTRTWTDANRNFTPDCNLQSGAAQDLRASGGDFCGAWANQNFGQNVYSLSYDEQILKGWGVRPGDWQIGATVQHEVLPRVSVEAGYLRRWLQNFTVTDNLAVAASDSMRSMASSPNTPRST